MRCNCISLFAKRASSVYQRISRTYFFQIFSKTILLLFERPTRGSSSHISFFLMATKIELMIAWIPFIGTVIYCTRTSDQSSPKVVSEILASIAIPINSLLNPIFYSTLDKEVSHNGICIGAEAGGWGYISPPNNWTPFPPIITKCIPPIFLICLIC